MKIPPASHTMVSDLANCMWKGYRKYIAKDLPKGEKSPAQLEGIRVHAAFESALRSGETGHLPAAHAALVKPLIAANAEPELKMGASAEGEPMGFFDQPWFRGVADAAIVRGETAVLIDWKTGKVREDNRELMAQAFLLKAKYSDLKKVTGHYVWLVENRIGQAHDVTATARWEIGTQLVLDKAQESLDNGNWPKTPNPLCGWCDVKDCEHNRS